MFNLFCSSVLNIICAESDGWIFLRNFGSSRHWDKDQSLSGFALIRLQIPFVFLVAC